VVKRVVSVSLGASDRDFKYTLNVLGEEFSIERMGADGDMRKAVQLVKDLDGKVDAFGMGGIDIYVRSRTAKYIIRSAAPLLRAARKTPMVDGSGLKHLLERRTVHFIDERVMPLRGKRCLVVSAVDRIGMAEGFTEVKADTIFGDFIFVLGLPIPLRTLGQLEAIARLLAPILVQLPFSWLYPTGEKQKGEGQAKKVSPTYARYYDWAEVVGGDWHYIAKYMPERMDGKVILTNTVTTANIAELKTRGVKTLVTATPDLGGRSPGTNVIEAILITLSGKSPAEVTEKDYDDLLNRIGFQPRVEQLN
jgi:hypothetical protein